LRAIAQFSARVIVTVRSENGAVWGRGLGAAMAGHKKHKKKLCKLCKPLNYTNE
jgi:hypothetical protein